MYKPQRRSGSPPPVVGRRRFLGVGLGATALAAAGLAGCGGTPLIAGDTLRYWNLFTGGDGERMVEMQRAYRRRRPGVSLEAVTLSWGAPYYTKLAMAAAGGRAPDVAILHLSRLPGFAPGRLLDPFDLDLLAEVGISKEDFPAPLWDAATVDGKLYAVPLDTHALVLYVNRPVVQKAGLLASPNALVDLRDPNEFLQALDEIRRVTGRMALATGSDPSTVWRYFWTFYRQLGGDIELPIGRRVVFDRDKAGEILEFYRKVFSKDRASVSLDLAGATPAFRDGHAGLALNGNWDLQTFQTSKDETGKPDFTIVRVPALFGPTPYVQADSHSFVLPHQNRRDREADRRTYDFVATMLKNALLWTEGGGHIPAYKPVADSERFARTKPQSNYRDITELAQLPPEAWFTGGGSDFETQVGEAFGSVFSGSLSVQQGIDQFEAAMNKQLAVPSPV